MGCIKTVRIQTRVVYHEFFCKMTSSSPGCLNTQCVVYKISGYTPTSAIFVNAILISVSTAIGQLAREKFDPDGTETTNGYLLYLFVVFCTVISIHMFLFFGFGYGGGMLADEKHPVQATCQYCWTGNSVKNINIMSSCNAPLITNQPVNPRTIPSNL